MPSEYVLYIKPMNRDVYEMYKNHGTFHEGDVGVDLFCPEDIEALCRQLGSELKFKIKCEMRKNYYNENGVLVYFKNVGYSLYPRSSISRTSLRLANSVGVIDPGYRGELMAVVDNHSDRNFNIKKGERYFQITLPSYKSFSIKVLEEDQELSTSTRGEGGFGSTGK